ncbi:hypothetical protein BZU93_30690 [Salmonella enterica subsp. enterica]|nr:hypothetical protein [Escherichia coli]MIL10228.1 hypothetical protein [Salmonella enterica subsp. enterica serovar Enteritidis]
MSTDPTAYVLSANIHRRHMTKGQRAMAVAKIYPDPDTAHRGKTSETGKLLETKTFSAAALSQARAVIVYASELAPNVLSGAVSLNLPMNTTRRRIEARSPVKVSVPTLFQKRKRFRYRHRPDTQGSPRGPPNQRCRAVGDDAARGRSQIRSSCKFAEG